MWNKLSYKNRKLGLEFFIPVGWSLVAGGVAVFLLGLIFWKIILIWSALGVVTFAVGLLILRQSYDLERQLQEESAPIMQPKAMPKGSFRGVITKGADNLCKIIEAPTKEVVLEACKHNQPVTFRYRRLGLPREGQRRDWESEQQISFVPSKVTFDGYVIVDSPHYYVMYHPQNPKGSVYVYEEPEAGASS